MISFGADKILCFRYAFCPRGPSKSGPSIGNLIPNKSPITRWDLALEMLTTLGAVIGGKIPYLTAGHFSHIAAPIVGGPPLALLYGIKVQFGAVIWEYTSAWALL